MRREGGENQKKNGNTCYFVKVTLTGYIYIK